MGGHGAKDRKTWGQFSTFYNCVQWLKGGSLRSRFHSISDKHDPLFFPMLGQKLLIFVRSPLFQTLTNLTIAIQ